MSARTEVLALPVTITKPVRELLLRTSNDGGYYGVKCLGCGKSGWEEHMLTLREDHGSDCAVARAIFGGLF